MRFYSTFGALLLTESLDRPRSPFSGMAKLMVEGIFR